MRSGAGGGFTGVVAVMTDPRIEEAVAALVAEIDRHIKHGHMNAARDTVRAALVAERERALREAEQLCDTYDHSAYAGRAIRALRERP